MDVNATRLEEQSSNQPLKHKITSSNQAGCSTSEAKAFLPVHTSHQSHLKRLKRARKKKIHHSCTRTNAQTHTRNITHFLRFSTIESSLILVRSTMSSTPDDFWAPFDCQWNAILARLCAVLPQLDQLQCRARVWCGSTILRVRAKVSVLMVCMAAEQTTHGCDGHPCKCSHGIDDGAGRMEGAISTWGWRLRVES